MQQSLENNCWPYIEGIVRVWRQCISTASQPPPHASRLGPVQSSASSGKSARITHWCTRIHMTRADACHVEPLVGLVSFRVFANAPVAFILFYFVAIRTNKQTQTLKQLMTIPHMNHTARTRMEKGTYRYKGDTTRSKKEMQYARAVDKQISIILLKINL